MKNANIASLLLLLGIIWLGAGCTREQRLNRHMARADKYYAKKEFEKARIEYLNALRLAPSNLRALRQAGTIFYDSGEVGAAYQLFSRAKKVQPSDIDVRLKLGRINTTAQRFDQAWDELIYVADRDPNHEDVLLLLATVANGPARIQEVLERLEQQRPTAGNKPSFHRALAVLRVRQKDFAAAEQALQKALELAPDSSDVYLDLATLSWAQDNRARAEQAFQKAAELAPTKSMARLRWADFKIKTGQLDEGKRILEEVTQQAPDWVPAWAFLAHIAFAEKRYDDCAALIQKVLERDPTEYQIRLLESDLSLARGDVGQAILQLEQLSRQYNNRIPPVLHKLAQACLRSNDVTRAMSLLNQAVALNTNYTESILLLAELNIRRGDMAAAIPTLQALTNQQPRLGAAYLLLADAYRLRGTPSEALAVYQGLETIVPTNSLIPLLRGRTLVQLKDYRAARAAFQKVAQLSPDYLPAEEQLVAIDLAERNYPAALQRARQLTEKHPDRPELKYLLGNVYLAGTETNQAEAVFQQTIEAAPDLLAAYTALAQIYYGAGRLDEALQKLNDSLAKQPQDLRALLLKAAVCITKKDYPQAAAAYEQVLVKRPRHAQTLNNLAYLYSENLGRLDRAYELAEQARQIDSGSTAIIDTLGWILFKRGEYARALQLLVTAAGQKSESAEVLFHLGMAYYMMGEEKLAQATLQQTLELSKEFAGKSEAQQYLAMLNFDVAKTGPTAINTLEKHLAQNPKDLVARMRLAAAYEQAKAFDQSRQTYEAALKLNPQAASVLVELSRLYYQQLGNAEKGLELAKEARKLAPDNPTVAYALGRLLLAAGDDQWALSLLQETARKQPELAELQYELAVAFYRVGQIDNAEAAATNALRLDPAFQQAAAAKELVDLLAIHKNPAGAAAALPRLQAILQKDKDSLPALFLLGLVREQQGNLPAAEQSYSAILQKHSSFPLAKARLAALYSRQPERLDQAYRLASEARTALASDAELARTLGKLHYRRGEFEQARLRLNEAARKLSADPELLCYLGMTQYRLGEATASKATLTRALAANPEAKLAEEAGDMLGKMQ